MELYKCFKEGIGVLKNEELERKILMLKQKKGSFPNQFI